MTFRTLDRCLAVTSMARGCHTSTSHHEKQRDVPGDRVADPGHRSRVGRPGEYPSNPAWERQLPQAPTPTEVGGERKSFLNGASGFNPVRCCDHRDNPRNPYRRHQRTPTRSAGRKRKPVNPEGISQVVPDCECSSPSAPSPPPCDPSPQQSRSLDAALSRSTPGGPRRPSHRSLLRTAPPLASTARRERPFPRWRWPARVQSCQGRTGRWRTS